MSNGATKSYHFCNQPKYGDSVKVYENKHQVSYGTVKGFFKRVVHKPKYITTTGKEIEAYDIITDCVLLDPCIYIEFNQIQFFLDIDRVSYE